MISEVIFTSEPYQDLTIDWMDKSLKFTMYWNDEADGWFFDVTEMISNTILITGVALVLGADMFEPFALNIGGLFCVNELNTNDNPTLEGLGSTFKVYLTDEL